MTDATRDEALQWCVDKRIDFTNPQFPPPEGWMWGDTGVPAQMLTAIHTNTEDDDIESVDVLFHVVSH